jgi:hypothetical protein
MRVFQRQVVDQCRLVLASVPMINQGAGSGDQDQLWIGCQMFVVGAGNTSKALWGDGRDRAKTSVRRQPLRESLEVKDDSPLYDLSMRNNFEHYDERIDRWWKESPSHNHLDRMIGSPNIVSGLTDIDRFRVYDPGGLSIVFWGQTWELQPIANECERVHAIASREAVKPQWEPLNASGSGQ